MPGSEKVHYGESVPVRYGLDGQCVEDQELEGKYHGWGLSE